MHCHHSTVWTARTTSTSTLSRLLFRRRSFVVPRLCSGHFYSGGFCFSGVHTLRQSGAIHGTRIRWLLESGNTTYSAAPIQKLNYRQFPCRDASTDDPDFELVAPQSNLTAVNVENWRSKFIDLLRNKDEEEIVSREKKDRRDFEYICALANRMGLHSRQYTRIVAFSKVPLPNYRSDLDDRRPQREVILPLDVVRKTDLMVKYYLSKKPLGKGYTPLSSKLAGDISSASSLPGHRELLKQNTFAKDKALIQRSTHLRLKQQMWKESAEGKKMFEFRKDLPAYKELGSFLKAVSENQVVIVSGETGCGKTTQLPQYILESEIEAGRGAYCNIICTQPRRISAMAVSERVAAERGEQLGESVGYKVRLEGMKGRDTHLLFCTTGILLRRLLIDRNLAGVTHIIVDEIHERGMNEDFLLIVLKDLIQCRPELHLILMSATLDANLFSSYFDNAPMIHIPGFTHPVQSHFLEDILEETGHRLTSYNQIDDYGESKMWKMQKQAQAFRKRKSQIATAAQDALESANMKGYSRRTQESLSVWNADSIGFNLIERVLCHIAQKKKPGAILVFMTGWDDINALKEQLQAHPFLGDTSRILLLTCHGSMDTSEQRLIFDKPKSGVRKIVLATNIAETSITINDVVFVVDCGKAKETSYDALNNTPCLLPSWISKAAAKQRRGRAGRVQPGECYHLYPKYVYNSFADYQLPELLRTPLQSLCLQIKSLNLGRISDFLLRALQPPELLSVHNAIECLKVIGALEENENLTVIGRHLSVLPVEPRLGKMLLLATVFNCVDPVITVVAGLSIRDPFMSPYDKKDHAESAKAQFSACDSSDHLALIRAFNGWKKAEQEQSGYEYCWKNFLSMQSLKAIDSLRKQLLSLLKDTGLVGHNLESCNIWSQDLHIVRSVLCAGLFPCVSSVLNKERSTILKTMEDGQVLLHSSSVNAGTPSIRYPWLVFNEKRKVNAVFLRDSTGISDSVLLLFGGKISRGGLDGHLKMLGGYLEFFMKPTLANTFLTLKNKLEELIQMKLADPSMDMKSHNELMNAVKTLIAGDECEGRFVFGHHLSPPKDKASSEGTQRSTEKSNPKNELQTLLARAGYHNPVYKTALLKNNKFRSTVIFNGLDFLGNPSTSRKGAEKDAASQAIQWLRGEGALSLGGDDENLSSLLEYRKSKSRKKSSSKLGSAQEC